MKFTFKTHKPTGQYFYTTTLIKLKKKIVGSISQKKFGAKFSIRFMVIKSVSDILEDGNPNCAWKWITFNGTFKTLDDAKEFVNKNIDVIVEKWTLAALIS